MQNKSLKIAFLTTCLLVKGGTQKQLLHLVLELRRDHKICSIYTFIYFKEGTFPEFSKLKIKSIFILTNKSFLIKIVKKFNVSMGLLERFLVYLAFFAQLNFVLLFKKTDYNILNPHDWFTAWVSVYVKKTMIPSAKIIVMLNDIPFAFSKHRFIRSIINGVNRYFEKYIDAIMVLDTYIEKKARTYYRNSSIYIVRSGLDIDSYLPFRNKKKYFRVKKVFQ